MCSTQLRATFTLFSSLRYFSLLIYGLTLVLLLRDFDSASPPLADYLMVILVLFEIVRIDGITPLSGKLSHLIPHCLCQTSFSSPLNKFISLT